MSNWKLIPLKDITLKIGSGATPKGGGDAYKEFGISLIRSQNVLKMVFSKDGLAFIDEKQAHDLRNVIVETSDVLLNITGDSVARCCMVPDYTLPARVNQHVCIIRANKRKLDPHFLMYSLNFHKEDLLSLSEIGATRRALTKTMVEDFQINLPAIEDQKSIAEVLRSLDDKIDLLHKQNQTLEQLAETMFRHLFLDVPSDSEEISLIDLASHIKDGVNPNRFPETLFYHYSLPAFDNGRQPEKVYGKSILSNKYVVSSGDILVSKLNPRTPRIWHVGEAEKSSICSTEFQVYKPKKKEYAEFVYCMLSSTETRDILAAASSGTSGSHQRVTPDVINQLSIKRPDENSLRVFHQQAKEWFLKVSSNVKHIQLMQQTRDTILPKLMSGVISVI
jgi:type I restriction enzyme, S subunit